LYGEPVVDSGLEAYDEAGTIIRRSKMRLGLKRNF